MTVLDPDVALDLSRKQLAELTGAKSFDEIALNLAQELTHILRIAVVDHEIWHDEDIEMHQFLCSTQRRAEAILNALLVVGMNEEDKARMAAKLKAVAP